MSQKRRKKRRKRDEFFDLQEYERLELEKKHNLSKQMTPDQKLRMRFYTESKFNPRKIQHKVLNEINISSTGRLAAVSVAKIYIGELVMVDWGEDPTKPIERKHLVEAKRRYEKNKAKFVEFPRGQRFWSKKI